MKEVTEKQEKLQKNIMETLEKHEKDRKAREEAWKTQEMVRIKRERYLLAQERSIAATKDAAVFAFLSKFKDQVGPFQLPENPIPNVKDKAEQESNKQECTNGGNFKFKIKHMSSSSSSSTRWPKDEVEALIRLRTKTNLDVEYEGFGPQWNEISNAMKKLGYERSAKRCKEKWRNINKYFKIVKEKFKKKKKPEDSKTCPYFHHLDALYSEKPNEKLEELVSSGKDQLRPEELVMHIMGGESSSSEDADTEKDHTGGESGSQ